MAIEPPMVKVCGLTDAADAAAAVALGAWGVGVVFADESPRRVDIDRAREVLAPISPLTARVGVFVDPDPEQARVAVEACGLSLVQAHRCSDPMALAQAVGVPVIEAFRVDGPEALERATASPAALILLDAAVAGMDGGTGTRFDWSLVEQRPPGRPFVLAGGLTPDNAAEAVERLRPDVLDVSSGVEVEPGIKDPNLIDRFMRAVAAGAERAG